VNETNPYARKRYLAVLMWVARIVILALLGWFLWGTWEAARKDLEAREFSVADLDWKWLFVSALFYVLAQLPAGWFWHQTLVAMGQRPGGWESFRAYYIGHLGKYVPGKAFVVIMRSTMIRSDRVNATVAALAVFVETLTLMAVGAVVAAVIVILYPPKLVATELPIPWLRGEIPPERQQLFLTILAVFLCLCAGIPTLPPIFRAVVRRLPFVKSHPAVEPAIRGLTLSLMARGWIAQMINWMLMGVSLWATLRAMGKLIPDPPELLALLPLTISTIALANVAGFLIPIPAGLGVREPVLIVLLEPLFGRPAALISAIVMRLVTVLAEAAVSVVLYPLQPRTSPPTNPRAATEQSG
jgi:uncharacterized membrane protein YbhN (UPF0104 family)